MLATGLLPGAVFLACAGLVLVLAARWARRGDRLEARLRDLAGKPAGRPRESVAQLARSARRVAAPLMPGDDEQRTRLQARLLHAGLYNRHALVLFLAAKAFVMLTPWAAGLAVGLTGCTTVLHGVAGGAVAGAVGMIAPGWWLDQRKARRQAALRRGLPDVLDLLVLCLEGGLSVHAAFRRVAGELRSAHPALGIELNIVQREMQLGQPLGEALRRCADRSDLEEMASLASIIDQTERFGSSLVKVLRGQAERTRFQRMQRMEERAQKAGAKILIPTFLFIFPAIFVIILGPAFFQVRAVMSRRKTTAPVPAKVKKATPPARSLPGR